MKLAGADGCLSPDLIEIKGSTIADEMFPSLIGIPWKTNEVYSSGIEKAWFLGFWLLQQELQ